MDPYRIDVTLSYDFQHKRWSLTRAVDEVVVEAEDLDPYDVMDFVSDFMDSIEDGGYGPPLPVPESSD